MWSTDDICRALTERGELWEAAPGLVGLRGSARVLCGALERAIASLLRNDADDEWRVPQAISLQALEQADYFASFPQWLTVAAHLDGDPATLERVAGAESPARAAWEAVAPADAALSPAVCYHVYAALADSQLRSPQRITVQGTCWRHEGERLLPLERGWAFTMRELVCIGSAEDVGRFLACGQRRVTAFAASLGLEATIADALDPFFAPAARGKALLQRVKRLKRELLFPLGPECTLAAASFNDHEAFFGEAFRIRGSDGAPASTGCIALGIERWVLAWMSMYGPDPAGWPQIERVVSMRGGE